MAYRLRVVRQLDGSIWAPYNCWVATTRGLCAYASNGKVRMDAVTARKRAGKWVQHPSIAQLAELGPGNLDDIKRALLHADTVAEFKKAGLEPPRVRNLGITKAGTVLTYLTQGYQVAVAIKYSVLRELRPRQAGSTTFDGGHSVRWAGAYDVSGKHKTTLDAPFLTDQLDPLCDGRRPGIAKGPQRLNRSTMLAETAAVELHDAHGNVVGHVGKGKILALVVKPAKPIPSDDPGPTDPDPSDCTECETRADAAEAEVGRLQGRIRAIAAALTDAQAPLNVINRIATDPANAGDAE